MSKLWVIISSILGVIGLGVGTYFIEESYTEVILHGGNNVNVTVKTEYKDLGFDVTHNNKIISEEVDTKHKYLVDYQNDEIVVKQI